MWRGIEWVEMIWHWTQSDPELKYEWVVANYWTVEDWLYDRFKEDLQESGEDELYDKFVDKDKDIWFNRWLKENDYLIWDIFSQIKQHNIL